MAQNERSFEVFGMHQKSTEAFDYFVCGVSGAIFAYIVKDYSPQKLALDASILFPIALLLLGASFFTGLKMIEAALRCMRFEVLRLAALEKVETFAKAMLPGANRPFDTKTLAIHTPDSCSTAHEFHLAESQVAEKLLKKSIARVNLYQQLRDFFLVLGFATILCAKIAQPYAREVSAEKTIAPEIKKPMQPLSSVTNLSGQTNR